MRSVDAIPHARSVLHNNTVIVALGQLRSARQAENMAVAQLWALLDIQFEDIQTKDLNQSDINDISPHQLNEFEGDAAEHSRSLNIDAISSLFNW
jgi:hypothetical protein